MNPYERFRTLPTFLASALSLATIVTFGPVVRQAITQFSAGNTLGLWAGLAGVCLVLLIVWSVLAGSIFPAILRTGALRRIVLGRAYVEGSWIQAERGGPNGPRIAIVSLKPTRHGLQVSSTTLTRSGEMESGLQSEFQQFTRPKLDFKFRETVPEESGLQKEGFGEIQFDLTDGQPRRYSGCLQLAGAVKRIKTEGIKLTSWKERRKLRSLDGRRDVLAKYWSAYFEGPITPIARGDDKDVSKLKTGRGKGDVVSRTRPSDWRKSDTTPTADRIRGDFSAAAD